MGEPDLWPGDDGTLGLMLGTHQAATRELPAGSRWSVDISNPPPPDEDDKI